MAELQHRLVTQASESKTDVDRAEALVEARAALEAERAGSARLERALAAALADNAALAAGARAADHAPQATQPSPTPPDAAHTKICPIDSFLAD